MSDALALDRAAPASRFRQAGRQVRQIGCGATEALSGLLRHEFHVLRGRRSGEGTWPAQRGGCEAVLKHVKAHCPDASSAIRDLVVGAECVRAKPHPDPYLEGASRVGLPPARCIVFEDSRTGIKAGVAAGCVVVGLTTSMTAIAMREAGCAATVRDWSEVTAEFLQGLMA